jgi:hypothetical protein
MMLSPVPLPELPGLAHGGDARSHPQPTCPGRNVPNDRLEAAGMVIVGTCPRRMGGKYPRSVSGQPCEGEMYLMSARRADRAGVHGPGRAQADVAGRW